VGEVAVGDLLALLHAGDVGGQKWTPSQARASMTSLVIVGQLVWVRVRPGSLGRPVVSYGSGWAGLSRAC
jgi:hypothetical protein